MKHTIGENIRETRQQQAMSLNDLALRSGFSKGYVSKLENGHAQAPIATLMRIAKTLNTTMNQLFDGSVLSAHTQHSVLTKKSDRELTTQSAERSYSYERLARGSAFRLSPYIIHLNDDTIPTQAFQHSGEEIIYMLSGSCSYRVGDVIHDLEVGDTLIFDATQKHGPIKLENIEAHYLAIFDEH